MKQLMKLGSLLAMVMLLAMGTMVTSCGDDDDEGGVTTPVDKVVVDGKELTVSKITYSTNSLESGNNYHICMYFTDNTVLTIMLSGDKYDNKTIDLSKGEPTPAGWSWLFYYTGGGLFGGDGEYDDPDPFDAGSSMKVTCLNKKTGEFEIIFSVKKDGHSMTGHIKSKLQAVD